MIEQVIRGFETLWPLIFPVIGALLVAKFTQPYWQPWCRAQVSIYRIRRYQPVLASEALLFYLYHLQRVAERHEDHVWSEQSAEHWLGRLARRAEQLPAVAAFADLVLAMSYRQEEVALTRLQQAALAALEELLQH